uniref:Leucine rich repeat kinase 2 n=1 Tax=Callorhinchus milii TaxID=7868 RepID=A0A4W3JT00_CALMI
CVSSSCSKRFREEHINKLIVRLQNVQVDKSVDTLLQILEDLLQHTSAENASSLFQNKNVYINVLVVLESYINITSIQQVGWSLLYKLIELCPSILNKLAAPWDVGKDWDVLGDTDIFTLVVEAMRTFATDSSIQMQGSQVLCALLEKVSDEQVIEFVEGKDHWVILEAIKHLQQNEDSVLHALRALLPLARPPNNVEILMSGNEKCYTVVMTIMTSFPDNEAIQDIGCRLFQKFTLDNFYNILVLNGVQEVIVKAVVRYPANSSLQAAGLSTLALLTETIFVNKDLDERKDEEDLCWLEACCKALEFHKENQEVQEAACWALNNLLMYQNDLHEKFGDDETRFPVHRLVMAAMLLHSTSKEVFQASANALATLADQSVRIRKLLLAKGIHINILDLMKKHSDCCDVLESACKVLNKLFFGSILSIDVMSLSLTRIVSSMKSYEQFVSVQLEALRTISHFIFCKMNPEEVGRNLHEDTERMDLKQKVIKNQCLLEGVHTLVLEAMNKFVGNPALQQCGLRVLYAISDCSGSLEMMTAHGAMDTVLHTMQIYPHEREIQCLSLKFLFVLAPKKHLSNTLLALSAKVIVETLLRFEEDTEIQIQGFQVALMCFTILPSAATTFFMESIDKVIFRQMILRFMDDRNKQLQNLICKCLSKLCCDNAIKNKMLQNACSENNVTMAESLIILGADVNQKSWSESLIYQACERSNNPLLVELLLNSGTREQDIRKSLDVSIKKGDANIIGLLLKKLGLDQNNKAICLGGCRMGKIEAAWLSPLFPDEKLPVSRGQLTIGTSLAKLVLRYRAKPGVLLMHHSSTSSDMSYPEEAWERNDNWILLPELSATDSEESGTFCTDELESEGLINTFSYENNNNNNPYIWYSAVHVGRIFQSTSQDNNNNNPWSSLGSGQDLAHEFECIKSLDLSANELDNLNSINEKCPVSMQLATLQKLDLHQNNLMGFSKELCTIFKGLTDLDLSNNKFTSFPCCVLEMPSINTIDISKNNIGHSLILNLNTRCTTLKQLILSQNQLSSFPECLGEVITKIEELFLKGNKISTVVSSLCLTELNLLDLSQNCITIIPDTFLIQCPKMEIFRASENHLSILSGLPSKITVIELANNNFHQVPKAVLQLQHLRSINLSHNKISELPRPVLWASSNIRELIFSHNQIRVLDLSEGMNKWSRLGKLDLSNNNLKEVKPFIYFVSH